MEMGSTSLAGMTATAGFVGATLVVAPVGALDYDAAPELERFLRSLEPLPDIVAIDLAEVPFVDAAGLSLLLAEHARAVDSGRRTVLIGLRGPVLATMRLTGLDAVLAVAADI
jgi:anti-anti-sigma factor